MNTGKRRSIITRTRMLRVGVLSLQGDVEEHISAVRKAMESLGIAGSVEAVRPRESLRNLSGLVIPGGESTTISKLVKLYGMDEEIKRLAASGVPIMGTCAGLVLLSSRGCEEVDKTGQALLGVIDVSVDRNTFGRQRESFEAEIDIPVLGGKKYHAVFIRAPSITSVGLGVRVLARYGGRIVAAEKDNILVLSFHPELSDDLRMEEYFIKKVVEHEKKKH